MKSGTVSTVSPSAAATAKSLHLYPTLFDPIDGSPPGSPVPGILQARTHWSGLPFPSPMHESEKWKWSLSGVSDSLRPHGLQPTRLLHPWDFPGKSTGAGCHCLLCFPHLFAMKWQDWMPWSLVFECWILSQLFHSPLLPSSSRVSLVPLHFLPLKWYHLYIWGYWYFFQQSCVLYVMHICGI